ncbi:hypothetical protein NG726_35910, partial [Pseudomonas sp. MOB-449]|nr:hypothetical protein [Pseudomonas sp. MOB-449]
MQERTKFLAVGWVSGRMLKGRKTVKKGGLGKSKANFVCLSIWPRPALSVTAHQEDRENNKQGEKRSMSQPS